MELINPQIHTIHVGDLTELCQLLEVRKNTTSSAFPSDSTPLPEGCDGWYFIVTGLIHSTPDIKVYMNQVINTRVLHADILVHPKCKIEVI
ncbi:hypothetical protein VPHD520_0086 [Vibrio phage D520]